MTLALYVFAAIGVLLTPGVVFGGILMWAACRDREPVVPVRAVLFDQDAPPLPPVVVEAERLLKGAQT